MESFLLVTSHYYRLLMITAQYFLLKSLLLVSAHYYRLLPIASITVHLFTFNHSNESIATSLLPHYYKHSGITAITAHYFHFIISYCYYYYPLLLHLGSITASLLPHSTHYFHIKAWLNSPLLHHYYFIAPELSLDVHYFPSLLFLTVVIDWLLHHYFFITICSGALLLLLPITSISLLLITTKRVFITTNC